MPSGGRPWRRASEQVRAKRLPCWLCGKPIDYDAPARSPGAFSVDHVTPTSHGGTDALSNLKPAHYSCNSARGNTSRGQFPTSRRW